MHPGSSSTVESDVDASAVSVTSSDSTENESTEASAPFEPDVGCMVGTVPSQSSPSGCGVVDYDTLVVS